MSSSASRKNQLKHFETLRRELKTIVLDQDDAIDEVVDAFIHMAFRPPKEAEPKAIFTFLGPPGVGKIYLARVLCSMLKEVKGFKHFDLERYSDPESGGQLLVPQMVGQEIRETRRFFIEQILKKPNDGKIDIDKVVRYISGMNGYELQRIGKEASLHGHPPRPRLHQ